MKKLIAIIVLLSMVLHSASRLGVLSYLYQQRYEIAVAVGVMDQVPVSECGSHYDPNSGLVVVTADEDSSTLPPALLQAKEIQLFFNGYSVPGSSELTSYEISGLFPDRPERKYSSPIQSIFHPPSQA